MPSVGTLNLTVESNASKVGESFAQIADALERIRKAVPENGLGLSGIAQEVKGFVTAISGIKNSSTVFKNIEALGNGIRSIGSTIKYSTDSIVKEANGLNDKVISSINVQPLVDSIKAIKAAIGKGFNIGLAGTQLKNIRDALSGEWNVRNSKDAGESLKIIAEGAKSMNGVSLATTAKNISALAVAFTELSNSLGGQLSTELPGVFSAFTELGKDNGEGFAQGILRAKESIVSASVEITKASMQAVKDTQDSNSPSEETRILGHDFSEGYILGIRDKVSEVASEAANFTESAIIAANENATKAADIAASAIRTAVGSAINGTMYSDASKSMVNSAAASAAEFTQAIVRACGTNFEGAAKEASGYIRSVISAAVSEAAKIEMQGLGMQGVSDQATAEVQQISSEVQRAGDVVEAKMADKMRETVAVSAEILEQTQQTTQSLEEQLRVRREIMEAENQRRLESSYSQYRELFLSNEGNWEQQVPEMYGFTPKAIEQGETYADALRITMQEVNQYVDEFIDKMNMPQGLLLADAIQMGMEAKLSFKDAAESAQELKYAAEIPIATSGVSGDLANVASTTQRVKASLQETGTATRVLTDDLTTLDSELKSKKADMNGVTESATNMRNSFLKTMTGTEELGGSFKKLFPTIASLTKRFQSMAKMRMMRYAIRQIAAGVTEGLKNVYFYSKAVGTDFGPAMDSAASSLLKMKNSIGAMLAPALQALIPLLQTVINGFISALNYVNQLFALLRGQKSWTRAVDTTTEAYTDNTKEAKNAAKAAKDLLADWDELNIIQSQGGDSGTGKSKKDDKDYASMFEEVKEYDEAIKTLVAGIDEQFGGIGNLAKRIGALILGWKFSKAFGGTLGLLGSVLGQVMSIGLTIELTDMFAKNYTKTGESGWLIADALTGLFGSAIARKFATKIAGGTFGMFTQGITLILSGAVNIKNAVDAMTQKKDAEAWMLEALGLVETGVGAGLTAVAAGATITGALLTGLVVTFAAATLTVPLLLAAQKQAEYRQMAIDAFKESGEGGIDPEEYLKAMQTRLDELTKGAKLIIDAHLEFEGNSKRLQDNLDAIYKMNAVLRAGDTLTPEEAETFKTTWHTVFEAMDELSSISFNTIYAGLSEVIANGSKELKTQAAELRKQTIEIAGIVGGTRGRLQKEMDLLVNTITSGTAKPEELQEAIARYDQIYKLLAETEDSGISVLEEALKAASAFDFTKDDSQVNAAVDFIQKISEENVQPALEAVNQAYEAGIESIDEVMKELKLSLDAGDITKEEYDKFYAVLLGDKEVLKQRLDEQTKEIIALQNNAYATVLKQAWRSYSKVTGEDKAAAGEFVDKIFNPLLEAAEAAGYDTSLYRNLLKPEDAFYEAFKEESLQEIVSDRDKMYQDIYDTYGGSNELSPIKKILSIELEAQAELTGVGQIEKGSDLASEIITSILGIEGISYKPAIEAIAASLGWSIEDILTQIDLSKFDTDELELLLESIEEIKSEFEFKNPISPTDVSDATERTKQIAQAYEDMAKRVREALDSLNRENLNTGIGGSSGIKLPNAQEPSANAGGMLTGQYVPHYVPLAQQKFIPQAQSGANEESTDKLVSGVTAGVKTANADHEALLSRQVELLTRILNKETPVIISPSSTLGRVVRQSNYSYDRVTGEDV